MPRFRDGQSTSQNQTSSPILGHIVLDDIDMPQLEDICPSRRTRHHILTSFDEDVRRIDNEVKELKNDVAQTTNGSSDTNSKIISLAGDLLSSKAEIKEIRQELRSLVVQDHLKQELASIRNNVAEASDSLRAEYSSKWEEHQQRFDLLESQLMNARRDLRRFQTLPISAETTAELALEASDTNAEEIIGLKGRIQGMEKETIMKRELVVLPQRGEPRNSQVAGLKRKAAPDDYLGSDIDFSILSPSARNAGDRLRGRPSQKRLRNAASVGPPKITRSEATDKRTLEEASSKPASV
ncbi:hypothetical protein O1611_g8153 [Lasiodiplodia mahajangana]|uniref:Uncharacterized protein n=1 Tax=Lasiodiplodia mahajangana TaxID=1108764 RepID=A0ACC2JDV3_9PEZI|nr:hypothetical protein O1611_g8153 [Lasiodiplodia mahajangana]